MVASALEVFDTGRGTTLPTRGGAIYCGNHLYRCGASILDLKGLGKELWVACAVTTAFGGCVRTWRSTVPLADALGFATSNAERYAALGAASIQLTLANVGQSIVAPYIPVLGGNNGGMTFQYVAGQQANVGNLQLTTSNGELTGATMSLPFSGYHANTSIVNIGTHGDSYYFVPFPYCGSTSFASLCDGSMSSAIAGLALVRGRRFVPMSRAVG
jgi:hypothetical protein